MLNKKLVRVLIIVLVLSMIVLPLISAVISADDCNIIMFNFKEDTEDIFDSRIFYSKDLIITGSALENTKVTVNKYWWKNVKKRSIIFKDENSDTDNKGKWVLIENIGRTVGASETFTVPIKINLGKYKIEIIAEINDETIYKEIEIEYNDKEEINNEVRQKLFRGIKLNI